MFKVKLAAVAVAVLLALGAVVAAASPASASGAASTGDGGVGVTASICNGARWFYYAPKRRDLFVPTINGNSTCYLWLNIYDNNGVVALQNMLIKCYGQNIARDGDFGPATEAALKNAQRIEGIADDGRYGPETDAAVMWPMYVGTGRLDTPHICVDP